MARGTTQREFVVYVIAEHENAPICKVGFTSNVKRRLSQIQAGSPQDLCSVYVWPMPSKAHAQHRERLILHIFRHERMRGEWICLTPEALLSRLTAYDRYEALMHRLQICKRRLACLSARWSHLAMVIDNEPFNSLRHQKAWRGMRRLWRMQDKFRADYGSLSEEMEAWRGQTTHQ